MMGSTVAARFAARILVGFALFGLVSTGAEAASKSKGGGYAPPYSELVLMRGREKSFAPSILTSRAIPRPSPK